MDEPSQARARLESLARAVPSNVEAWAKTNKENQRPFFGVFTTSLELNFAVSLACRCQFGLAQLKRPTLTRPDLSVRKRSEISWALGMGVLSWFSESVITRWEAGACQGACQGAGRW